MERLSYLIYHCESDKQPINIKKPPLQVRRWNGGLISADFEPIFGHLEVWAEDLTRCQAETSQIYISGGFNMASGEIWGHQMPQKWRQN